MASEVRFAATDEQRLTRRRLYAGLALILLLGAFGAKSFVDSLATFTVDYNVVRGKPGVLLQVPGVVDKSNPQRYNAGAGTFEFVLLDVERRADRLPVRAHTVKPANFDSASQITVIGTWADGVFDARQILVKCPSKELERAKQAQSG
jgi:cytochrome c-type biogenesis protein CcmE